MNHEAAARWLMERMRKREAGKLARLEEYEVEARSYAPKQVMFICAHAVDGLMVDLRADPMFQRPMGGRE